jgi:hypothetical protein
MRRLLLAVLVCVPTIGLAQPPQRLEFRRLVAHWTDYAKPEYIDFLRDARPEIAQVGFYGAHFWSLAHTPFGKGYPAHFPVVGLNECGEFFADLNKKAHKEGAKVVGHFNVEFLVGDPESKEGPRGFFKFYKDLWDEKLLGPKPVADPLDLLERDAEGKPIVNNSYSIGGMKEYWACLNNPNWRKVLKAWVKVGIDRGVDGYISNYYYRHNCLCEHCQASFRTYLGARFDAGQLKTMGIDDLKSHKFTEIGAWHNPKESTPLKREALRYSQIRCKDAYDEVFVKYGRSLKKDLILAQWNHLSNFSQINGDERCMLPKELWGKDEDYAWYSTGAAAVYTNIEKGDYGEGTLQARYIRGAFDNKPFTLGKYENARMRVAIAELAANGGAPMGFYTNFKDPVGRETIVRYYNFLAKHDDLYRGARSAAEVLLLFPRSAVHTKGDVEAVARFKEMGRELLDKHVLFDVLPDDLLTPERAKSYRQIVRVTDAAVSLPQGLSTFKAPQTVRVSADFTEAKKIWSLHLVNYNREKDAPGKSRGPADERPEAVENVAVNLAVPSAWKVKRVTLLRPEEDPVELKADTAPGRIAFTVPRFLAYAVVRMDVE